MEQTKAITTATETRTVVPVAGRGIQIQDMDSLWRFATAVAASGLAPKGISTKEAVFVAMQMGMELGLTPMSALQNIAVINGRPSLWGDAMLAVCRQTGELEEFEEFFEEGGKRLDRNPAKYTDDVTAVCRIKRKGYQAAEQSFSVGDSKLANLWGKQGPWKDYPWRMLKARARSFALRDQFSDALRGFRSAEEVGDIVDLPSGSVRRVSNVSITSIPAPQAHDSVEETAEAEVVQPETAEESPPTERPAITALTAKCADLGVSLAATGRYMAKLKVKGAPDLEAVSDGDLASLLADWEAHRKAIKATMTGGAQ